MDAFFHIAGRLGFMVTVTVRYFAAAAEAAGREEELIELDGAAPTVGTLRDRLLSQYGAAMDRVLRSGSFLVDGVVRRDPASPVSRTVDVLPPFAGG
jgi:molybdopterin converting factor small subunit